MTEPIPNPYIIWTQGPRFESKDVLEAEGKWVSIPVYALKYSVHFPLHEFISSFLFFIGLKFL